MMWVCFHHLTRRWTLKALEQPVFDLQLETSVSAQHVVSCTIDDLLEIKTGAAESGASLWLMEGRTLRLLQVQLSILCWCAAVFVYGSLSVTQLADNPRLFLPPPLLGVSAVLPLTLLRFHTFSREAFGSAAPSLRYRVPRLSASLSGRRRWRRKVWVCCGGRVQLGFLLP